MSVRIVTDSACDLPAATVAELGIRVVPLRIRFGGDEYTDGDDLSTAEFWKQARTRGVLPATAAPSPGAFGAAFEGAEAVVCVHMSGKLSEGTAQAAHAASKSAAVPVEIVDSQIVSRGLGWAVVAAAACARAGGSADACAAAARETAGRVRLVAALDTLDYLRKGGRIGKAQAAFGTLLSVKPLVTLAAGVVEAAGRVRTRSKAVDVLLERLPTDVRRVAVMHGDAPDADQIARRVAAKTAREPEIDLLGPVIGAHTGPSVTALIWEGP
jgi:DegV family protein with EDD domain